MYLLLEKTLFNLVILSNSYNFFFLIFTFGRIFNNLTRLL